jgi:hypothetical protein
MMIMLSDNRYPAPEVHRGEILRLKTAIKGAGGDIVIDAKEVEEWGRLADSLEPAAHTSSPSER